MKDDYREFLEQLKKDFYEYTKIDEVFFSKFSQVGVAGKEWDTLGLDNQDPKISYYYYLTSSMYFLGMTRLQFKRKLFRFDMYEKYANGAVLDFGAGTGGESFYIAQKGADITYYEPNSIARDFMRYRSDKYKVQINILPPWKFDKDKKKFDTIFCFDVFDHIPNWRNLIPMFKNKLKKNGVLIHQTKFAYDTADCPYHFDDSVGELNKELKKHIINFVQIPSV